MRKLTNYFFVALAAVSMVFTSCEDEEALEPEISFFSGDGLITGDATIKVGETASFSWQAEKGDANLSEFTIRLNNEDVPGFPNSDIEKDQYEDTWDTTLYTAGEYTFTFIVEDKDGLTASESITVTVEDADLSLSSYTAILMGGQSNSTYGSFLDADAGKVYLSSAASGVQGDIDIVYYYGSTNNATLAAPSDETVNGTGSSSFSLTASWTTQNETTFNTNPGITADDFDDMTTDASIADISTSVTKVTSLAADDVVVFTTAEGKKGALKVVEVSGEGSGTIEIQVKIVE